MTHKHYSILDKIHSILLSLIFILGSISFVLIIFMEQDHIICQKNGYCKYYTTFINKNERDINEFNIKNIKNFVCESDINHKYKNTFQLISIDSMDKKNVITQRSGAYKHCNKLKSVLDNYNENEILNFTYYPNKHNTPWWLWIAGFGGLLLTIFITYAVVFDFINSYKK